MAILNNAITINAPIEKIWNILADPELLDQYDPTVKKSTLILNQQTGLNAARKVTMQDGKNWFEEKITLFEPNEALAYQLTDCSFPIIGLTHSYSFEKSGDQTKVKQVMAYTVKFGLFGKLLDRVMIRKQTQKGIKKFFDGLKNYTENN